MVLRRGYSFLRKFRHQEKQHNSKENERGGPDHTPDIIVPLHVPWLVFQLIKFHGGCQVGACGHLGFLVSLKANRPIDFRVRVNRYLVSLDADTAANFSGQPEMLSEPHDLTPG